MDENEVVDRRRRAAAQHGLMLELGLGVSGLAAFDALERVMYALNPDQWEDAAVYERWLIGASKLAKYMDAPNPNGVRWQIEVGPDGVKVGLAPERKWGLFLGEEGLMRLGYQVIREEGND